jgi:hypothetical protein
MMSQQPLVESMEGIDARSMDGLGEVEEAGPSEVGVGARVGVIQQLLGRGQQDVEAGVEEEGDGVAVVMLVDERAVKAALEASVGEGLEQSGAVLV